MKTGLSSSKTSTALILTLLLVLAHSLFRLAITPPWGFSDEPAHFEVVEYLAKHWQWPTLATADLAIRQEISDTSDRLPCLPDEPWTNTCIGVNQYDELPLFHLLQAIVQIAIPLPGLIQRLYLARCVSLGLSLLTAWLAFQLALEVWDRRWKPAALVVLVMGTNFSYIGSMLAVNNDTLAVCSVTFLAFATVRLLKRGLAIGNLLLWVVAIGTCFLTKSSTLIASLVALALVAGQLSLRWVQPKFIVLAFALASLGGCAALTTWTGQPGWNVSADHNLASPAGSRVLSLSSGTSGFQGLPPQSVEALRGQEVTLRAAVYASNAVPVQISIVSFPDSYAYAEAETSPGDWSNVVLVTRIPKDAQYVDIVLSGSPDSVTLWDGIALFDSSQSRQWIFNGDGETIAPMFIPRVGNIFIAGRSLNERLVMIYDLPRSLYFYPLEARYLFSTFWGGWGWNHVSLSKSVIGIYALITGLSGLGLSLWWLTLYRRQSPAASVTLIASIWLALLVAAILSQSILRVDYPQATYPFTIYGSARYAFPIMAPFSVLIVAGLRQCAGLMRKPRWVYRFMAMAAVAAFLVGIQATLFIHIPSFRESPHLMNPAYFPY